MKILRFRKGGGRMKKKVWRWKGEVIDEIKEFKYLGCISEEWEARGTYKRPDKKSDRDNRTSMGNREKKVQEGFREKIMAI